MQESPCLNSDCFGENRLLPKKYFNMFFYMLCMKTLLKIGKRETGQYF